MITPCQKRTCQHVQYLPFPPNCYFFLWRPFWQHTRNRGAGGGSWSRKVGLEGHFLKAMGVHVTLSLFFLTGSTSFQVQVWQGARRRYHSGHTLARTHASTTFRQGIDMYEAHSTAAEAKIRHREYFHGEYGPVTGRPRIVSNVTQGLGAAGAEKESVCMCVWEGMRWDEGKRNLARIG